MSIQRPIDLTKATKILQDPSQIYFSRSAAQPSVEKVNKLSVLDEMYAYYGADRSQK